MATLDALFQNNRAWAFGIRDKDPSFFERLSRQQTPKYLWIGCSDSRVPANEIVGLQPGELFVHRNIANLIVDGDLNGMSVLQYAIDVLGVEHVIVCGHYECGGVKAVATGVSVGLSDLWLRHMSVVKERFASVLRTRRSDGEATDLLCELNVLEQARNVCKTESVRRSWAHKPGFLRVHGVVYGLRDGLLRHLRFSASAMTHVDAQYLDGVAHLLLPRERDPRRGGRPSAFVNAPTV